MEGPGQLLYILKKEEKATNFANQQEKPEEENSGHLFTLNNTQKCLCPFQGTGAPTLTGRAPGGLGSSSGTSKGGGLAVCKGVTLCNFFSGRGNTGLKVGGCFFFLRVSPVKEGEEKQKYMIGEFPPWPSG